MTEAETILALNAGSSSLKFAGFNRDLQCRFRGKLEGIGTSPKLDVSFACTEDRVAEDWSESANGDVTTLIHRLISWIENHTLTGDLAAIGHRVAIGGLGHSGPARITGPLLEKLRTFVPLAPLHQPRNLEPIELLRASHPHVPQVACFDTAFHRTLPSIAQIYGLPRDLTEAGALRYGFHGLSYEYVSGVLSRLDRRAAQGRTIICHLGSGASLCALERGRSVATTMGFSPLSGLVMATRPGEVDAGLMIWLLRERGMSVDEIESMLYRESGLKGVSGISGDMRTLQESTDPRAADAIELFVHNVVSEIGRLTAALGGLDALVFTAGIGENSPAIRAAICAGCGWLGADLDESGNRANASRISGMGSAIAVLIVPTDEERMVALHTAQVVLGMGSENKGHPK